jgi:hypothetical protein
MPGSGRNGRMAEARIVRDGHHGRPGPMSTPRHILLTAIVAALLAGAAAGSADPGLPACFGAAARDPWHPCTNPLLRHTVEPRPLAAELENDAPCHPFERATVISVCYFGVPATEAQETIAILGDSHATHWRPALEVLARAKGLRGASIARTSCPFSSGLSSIPSAGIRRSCVRHNRAIPGWLVAHPAIQTVFVAGNANARVRRRPGHDPLADTIAGDYGALRSLPSTVKHMIVIRDAVSSTMSTRGCVQRAIRRGQAAGRACAVPAARVVTPDPMVLAARRIGARVQVIDLKRFQCARSSCFPVVGGVLVHQDIDHLTRLFAETLGPYLLRAFDRLSDGWRKAAAAVSAAAPPPCFGAASRDPEHPCFNPNLRLSVTPKPLDAQLESDSPCQPISGTGVLAVCSFGAQVGEAADTVALIGDSHATHWRPALEAVARAHDWRVINMTRSSCPFTMAPPDKSRTLRKQCAARNRLAPVWLRAHPFIHTLFVAGHAGVHVFGTKESARFKRARAGYTATLNSLPATIQHIVVIRDVVNAKSGTINCVQRAMRAHRPAGTACALKPKLVARTDPAVAAAKLIGPPRADTIDLTAFQCSPRLCFPVIGGVLVHKDIGHITRLFATTLGPYLLREFDRVAATWPAS